MIDCYSCATTNGQRVVCMLEEVELPYRPIWVNVSRGETRTPQFLAINPRGAIPVIVDHAPAQGAAITLSQSGAILIYLAEKSGRLLPTGHERDDVLQWLFFAMSDIACASASMFQLTRNFGEGGATSFFVERVRRFLGALDERLQQRDYVAGDFSIADIALYPNLVLPQVIELVRKDDTLRKVAEWTDRMSLRPGIKRGMTKAPPIT